MQKSFSELEYEGKKKQTRRERFLGEIERRVPWAELEAVIAPHHPKRDGAGRPATGLSRMLRMYVAQNCFGLSDEGIEDAIYDSHAIRRFVGVDLGRESAPDATTLLRFRRLLEANDLTRGMFERIKEVLAGEGLMLREGTIMDATLIAAPPSTKNKERRRDPEMHSSKKGNQWHFGMKAHIGVDAESGLAHTVVATSGNVADVTVAHELLHGGEVYASGDSGYQGADKRPENAEVGAEWVVAARPGKVKSIRHEGLREATRRLEKAKASLRAKVEHQFHVVKNLFGHRKARYKGLAKNEAHLFTLFGLSNLYLAGRLPRPEGGRVS